MLSRRTTRDSRDRAGASARPRRPRCRSWSPRQGQSSKPIRPRITTVWSASRSRRATASTSEHSIQIGAEEGTTETLPHHIIVDRCYLHGDPRRGARRGVALNSRESAVINSYLSDFKEVGADSQAIVGWNGSGPFRIANNYLEAAGENVMFGGADPTIDGLVPADIEVVGNHMAKPLNWRLESELSGNGVERQEPVRAEKCPPCARRRQLVRVQLAARSERLCHSVYTAESGWPIALGGRRRHHVRQQPRAACGGRHQRAGPRRHSLQPADAPDRDPQQSISGRRRRMGIGPSLSAAGRHQRRLDRSQHGAADRHAGLLRRSRTAHALCLSEQHRVSQSVRIHRIGNRHGPPDLRSLLSGRAVPPQRDHWRKRRPLSARQFLPGVGRSSGFCRSAEARLSAQALQQLQACRHRPSGCRGQCRKALPPRPASQPARIFRGKRWT